MTRERREESSCGAEIVKLANNSPRSGVKNVSSEHRHSDSQEPEGRVTCRMVTCTGVRFQRQTRSGPAEFGIASLLLADGESAAPGRAGTSPFSRLVLGGFPGPPR
jgi:hypothetical protein